MRRAYGKPVRTQVTMGWLYTVPHWSTHVKISEDHRGCTDVDPTGKDADDSKLTRKQSEKQMPEANTTWKGFRKSRGFQLDAQKSSVLRGTGVTTGKGNMNLCYAYLHQTPESKTISCLSWSENALKMTDSCNQAWQVICTPLLKFPGPWHIPTNP